MNRLKEQDTPFAEVSLRFLSRRPIANGVGEAAEFDDPEWPRYIRITDIKDERRLKEDTFKSLPPEIAGRAMLERNDLLFAAVGASYGKSYLHINEVGEACYAGFLVRVSPNDKVDPRFMSFWAQSGHYWQQVHRNTVQATIQNFSAGKYRSLRMPCPDLPTQKRIAAFLDKETARIDALIEKNERLIEILTEKTYSDLFRCVFGTPDVVPSTYDPSVQMVRFDFGKIKIRPLKSYVSFVGKGSGQTSDICDDGEIPYITTEQMETGEPTKYTNKSPDGRKGDIALCTIASVGKSVLLPFDFRSNPQVSILRVKKDHNGWVAQALRLLKPVIIANANMSGVMPYINAREVGRITLPDLSFEEQASRFEKAWEISNRGYWLSKKLKDMNVLLKEKRSALITAAVTGQIDIPE